MDDFPTPVPPKITIFGVASAIAYTKVLSNEEDIEPFSFTSGDGLRSLGRLPGPLPASVLCLVVLLCVSIRL